MSATSDAAKLAAEVFAVLSTAKDDGGLPPRGLVHAALWAFAHSPLVEAVRETPPARGRLAELAELDPCALALITSSDNGLTALAADVDGPEGTGK